MIYEKDLINLCKSHDYQLFKTETELNENDIYLDTDDINEFFRLCKCYEETCIFYYYDEMEYGNKLSMDILCENIANHVRENINDLFRIVNILHDDITNIINDSIERYKDEIAKKIIKYNNAEYRGNTFYSSLDIYILHFGTKIGICLFSDEYDLWKEEQDDLLVFLNTLENKIINDIKKLVEEKELESQQKTRNEYERVKYSKEKAIQEIAIELNKSFKLLECTNGTLRHAYARELTEKYNEKYDIKLLVGDVDVLVNSIYKERK